MATVNYIVTTQQGFLHPDGPSGPGVLGGIYFLDGQEYDTINANRGDTLVFDMSDASNAGHEFRFTTDSTDAYTEKYTPGVNIVGFAGTPGSSVSITIPSDAPDELSVYCVSHGIRMGFDINVSGTGGIQGTYNYAVTVVPGNLYGGGSGNVYLLNGGRVLDLDITRGNRYVFDQTDASNIGHTLLFRYESNEGSGLFNLEWTAGVRTNGGSAGVDRIVTFQVPKNAPDDMLYVCDAHGQGMGGELSLTGIFGDTIENPADLVEIGQYSNPTITDVTFSQQFYDGALRFNQTLHRYEFFSEEDGWVQTTYAPTVTSVTGSVFDGVINSIVINGGGFDENMTVQIVSINDLYTPLTNPITFTYVDEYQLNATIDARAPYSLQDGVGNVLEAIAFRLTSGITNARAVSGEVEIDRDPEFGLATLTVLGRFNVNTLNNGGTTDVENPVIVSASDPDDVDAVVTFEVAPNTMGFGTNRNLASDGTTVGGRPLGSTSLDPNPQNSNFSVFFEYQEPNQGILKGAVNPWSNGGPGHPDYGQNFGTSVRYPGALEADHDLTVRATSSTPDGRQTTKDETFRMKVVTGWKYISNISHHYVMGGYIGAESWRVVHRCDASTDTTVSLGVQLSANSVTTPNANRSGARYSSEAVNRWSGQVIILGSNRFGGVAGDAQDQATENYNMITETAYGLTTNVMSGKRYDCQGFSYDHAQKGYAQGGYHPDVGLLNSTDKINLATATRETVITNPGGYTSSYGGASVFGPVFGTMNQAGRSTQTPDGGFYFAFSTDTPYGGNFQDLINEGLTGAVGKALTTWQDRNYWLGYNTVDTVWYGDQSTTTYGIAPFVQTLNNGEGNCSGGLAHGYSLGAYNGVQNNHADRINYSTETCVRVSSADTTGNTGTSSAAVGWVER
jgi:hypothetical protein